MGGICTKKQYVEPYPLQIIVEPFDKIVKKNKVLPEVSIKPVKNIGGEYWGNKYVGDINGSDSSI